MYHYTRKEIAGESKSMTRLALPVVLAQLSQMSMGFVDTYMVSDLGTVPLGAVATGGVIYFGYMVFAFGTLTAVSPMVAHAFGAGDDVEIGRSVSQGLWLSVLLTLFGTTLAWNTEPLLILAQQDRDVAHIAGEYVKAMSWGMIANYWFTVFRGFCDAVSRTRVAMVISFVAVFINIIADYGLIYGKLGMPELGTAGAGYATAIVRWGMLFMMLIYIFGTEAFRKYRFLYRARIPRPSYLLKMLRLGLPIGMSHATEHGAFGATSLLMGTISTVALAAHQVSIMLAAITFMVPMGISFAITTRVGQALGQGNQRAAALSGWVGIAIGTLFMMVTALLFISIPGRLATIFTQEPDVVAYATGLLVLAGAFQISDGIQVLAIGALRGMKDTARPMVANLIAYWLVGIPSGYLLAFPLGMEGRGLWIGLVIGLSVAAISHILRFRKLVGQNVATVAENALS